MKHYVTLLTIILMSIFLFCGKNDIFIENENDVQMRDNAIDFSEIDSQGELLTLKSRQGRVIVLNFSAMWCGACRAETSELEKIYETYKDRGLEVIQCIYDNESRARADSTDLQRWIQEFILTFSVVNDPDLSTLSLYEVSRIPLNIVIDKDFFIKYRREGFSKKELIQTIEANL